MQTLAENQEFRFGVSCEFTEDGPLPELPEDATINMYWITHEAVHNAIKHGESSHISIQLRRETRQVVLEIIDDGSGLPEPVEEIEEGMGLATMRYRANLIGATFDIQSREDGGVRVFCTLPTPSAAEGASPDGKGVA